MKRSTKELIHYMMCGLEGGAVGAIDSGIWNKFDNRFKGIGVIRRIILYILVFCASYHFSDELWYFHSKVIDKTYKKLHK